MSAGKPRFIIDLTDEARSPLAAHQALDLVDVSRTFHIANNVRPPIGIYNVSVDRVYQKVQKFCASMEKMITCPADERSMYADEMIDYIELSLYAAAEHVDDLKLIAENFYKDEASRKRSKSLKAFLEELKDHKKFVATFANLIKHSQSRVRLFSLDYSHGGNAGTLHGYFVEGVKKGAVGPHPVFHSSSRNIFSVTSLAWEIICFTLKCSDSLKRFLEDKPALHGPSSIKSPLAKAVAGAARLPLYTFDEDHPFAGATVQIEGDPASRTKISSGIYGSISNRWTSSKEIKFGASSLAFAGDGVTKTFQMTGPSRVGLQHWE